MEAQLSTIFGKPSDYKVCQECKHLNWYENDTCCRCDSTGFDADEDIVNTRIDSEYDFWITEELCSEEEADNIIIEV